MKKIRVLFLAIFSVIYLISCEPSPSEKPEEILEIQDPNFKNALLSTNAVDTNNDRIGDRNIDLNNDGLIQLEEVETVESLILGFDYGIIINSVDIREIEHFSNLKYLELTTSTNEGFVENLNDAKVSYDFTALGNLEILIINHLSSNLYASINVSNLKNLTKLDLTHNNPGYEIAPEDWKYPTHFTRISMQGCVNLEELILENSFLIVDFCEAPSIKKLNMRYLEGGEPEVFDFHCLKQLEELDISENLIHTLILKNGSVLDKFWANYIGNAELANYPFIKEVCIDDIPEELEQISEIINEDTVVTTDCTF
ncbi:hypothetical protein INR75_14040 [Zunongwangia sp. SCSIO 43204]|uniref:hypothetical protein n=1 Tax=Zunongwangia sp. SCSIO 43204 TaxID=2779359 RepID=UPI001CA983F2|nr:hypothetical protein [Zunongwangia sp. SCSIO 43204]UAB83298.1 hypothetical protein INR75_14040 [Zunongwangia sp. SCSIO 43204]